MMHTTNDSVVMALTKNMEHILAEDPQAAMDVFSYMRPISDDNIRNMYSNLQSSSLYMRKTQQMAKIIPSPVSYITFVDKVVGCTCNTLVWLTMCAMN